MIAPFVSSLLRKTLLLTAIFALTPSLPAAPAQPVWEDVTDSAPQETGGDNGSHRDSFEIEMRDGKIYIYTSRPVKVEIFTILGQLVTSRQVKAGVTSLSLAHRGIYILKSGTTARRINI